MYIDVTKYVHAPGNKEEGKINVNQFAKEIRINPNAAGKIFRHETVSMSFSTLQAICDTFKCTPNDVLIDGEYNKES